MEQTWKVYKKFVLDVTLLEPRSEFAPQLHYKQWLQEFATFKIDLGRQTGKTTTIIENALPDDIIISPNAMMQGNIKHKLTDFQRETVGIFSAKALPPHGDFRFLRNDEMVVWIDEPKFIDLDKLYDWLTLIYAGNTKVKIIIFGA